MTTPTLPELRAQLQALGHDRTATLLIGRLPADAPVVDRLAAAAEYAERRAVVAERERDLWQDVLTATYTCPLDGPADDVVLLLRAAALALGSHLGVEAVEARRYADGTAATAAAATERQAEQTGALR